jgi:hypothetical protein
VPGSPFPKPRSGEGSGVIDGEINLRVPNNDRDLWNNWRNCMFDSLLEGQEIFYYKHLVNTLITRFNMFGRKADGGVRS